jgi:hypothetical protein
MTQVTQRRLVSTNAPNLPLGTEQYQRQYQDQLNNILRLYFNQIDTDIGGLLGNSGSRYLQAPYGEWHDTTTQTAAANTVTLITLNAVDFEQTVTLVSSSKITAKYAGIYNVQFSIQLSNSGTADDNVTIWYRQNGTDVPNSAGIATCPGKHGSTPGALVFGWNEYFQMSEGDYLQLYWTTDSGNTTLATYAASVTAPVHPASPSVAVSATFVSALAT